LRDRRQSRSTWSSTKSARTAWVRHRRVLPELDAVFEVLDTFTTCGQRQQSPPASSLSTETTRDCQAPPSLSRRKREVCPTNTLHTHYNLRRFGHLGQLPPCGVAESSVNFAGDKSGNVTSAWWQVTLCDPVWHVSFRSGEASCKLLCCVLLTLLYLLIESREKDFSLSVTKPDCDCRSKKMYHKTRLGTLIVVVGPRMGPGVVML